MIVGDERAKNIELIGEYFSSCNQEVIWKNNSNLGTLIFLADERIRTNSPDVIIIISLLHDLIQYKSVDTLNDEFSDFPSKELVFMSKHQKSSENFEKLDSITRLIVLTTKWWTVNCPSTNIFWCLPYLPNFKQHNHHISNNDFEDDLTSMHCYSSSIRGFLSDVNAIRSGLKRAKKVNPRLDTIDLSDVTLFDLNETGHIDTAKYHYDLRWSERLTLDGVLPSNSFCHRFSVFLEDKSILSGHNSTDLDNSEVRFMFYEFCRFSCKKVLFLSFKTFGGLQA